MSVCPLQILYCSGDFPENLLKALLKYESSVKPSWAAIDFTGLSEVSNSNCAISIFLLIIYVLGVVPTSFLNVLMK